MKKTPRRPDTAAPSWSTLYCRTNGFMLGLFAGLIRYRFARPLFAQQRLRVLAFLDEAHLELPIPEDPDAYSREADALMHQLVLGAFRQAPELGRFVYIGGSAIVDAAMRAAGTVESDELRDAVVGFLDESGLEGAPLYERFLAEVAHERAGARPRVLIDQVLSPALRLLRDAIEPLPPDPMTCFVAMPFKPPYAGYFGTLYRPIAAALQGSALRMWGGLSGEDYVELMLAVIRRCGTVIADLSEVNPNVVFELGAARALDKRLVLLVQRRFASQLPANVGSEQLLSIYSPRERGWPSATAFRVAAQVLAIDLAQERRREEMARYRRSVGAALPVAHQENRTPTPARPGRRIGAAERRPLPARR